jgi:epoxyqueuosine reductase
MKLQAREDLKEPAIADLLRLDDPTFRTFFSGSPVKRIGRDRFVRNVLIAAGNSGDAGFVDQCRRSGRSLARGARHGDLGAVAAAGGWRIRAVCGTKAEG